MTTTHAWLGVDLGTSGVRALLVDDDGRTLGEGASSLTSTRDGRRHEQDPEDWWGATVDAIQAATRPDTGTDTTPSSLNANGPSRTRPVDAIAIDSTSGTFAIVDADGLPLSPGLMYDDSRAANAVGLVERINDVGADAWAAAGYRRMQQSWALPRLLWWLLNHDVPAGARLVHQGDFVAQRLVGHPVATDTSSALKTGADLHGVGWPTEVMNELGVPDRLLPPMVLPGTVLGHVSPSASAATGLPVGVPVVAGMTDGCAAQLGAGVVEPGDVNVVLGTTLVVKAVATRPVDDPAGVVYSHRSPTGHWLPGGASSVGAAAVTRGFDVATLETATASARSWWPTPIIRYPLASPGERFPFVSADATDLRLGIARNEVEAFAAGLQGVAYVERLCLDRLDLMGVPIDGNLRATGGASANRTWSQLRADIIRRPIDLPRDARPALGMAALAASATLGTALTEVVARMVRISLTLEPGRYDARHDDGYLRLIGALHDHGWLGEDLANHARERTTAWAST